MTELAIFEERPVEAIIGREPSWIVSVGITLIFIVVMLLLLMSWFIQYPDTIHAQITLTTEQPPVQLVAKTDGRITRIFVGEGEEVKQGRPLVLLENSVDYDSLLKLTANLKALKQADFTVLNQFGMTGLGQLQSSVNQLNTALHQLHVLVNSAQPASRVNNTSASIGQYRQLQAQLDGKQLTMKNRLALEADLLANNRQLKKQGLITAVELVAIENRYLDKKLALEDINIQRELYNLKISELAQQLAEYRIIRDEQTRQLKTTLSNRYSVLLSQIEQWQQTYLLTAPSSGVVSFSNYWSVNQQVKVADVVVSIINHSATKIGKILLDQRGAGKVKPGQRVSIELASFPAQEYGKLEGIISAISLIPGNRGYMVDVTLPETLITSYRQLLPFTPNLTGTAKVVTQQKRLIERLLDKVIYALN